MDSANFKDIFHQAHCQGRSKCTSTTYVNEFMDQEVYMQHEKVETVIGKSNYCDIFQNTCYLLFRPVQLLSEYWQKLVFGTLLQDCHILQSVITLLFQKLPLKYSK